MKQDILYQEENLEFLYDFKEANELLEMLKEYIEICEEEIIYSNNGFATYNGVMSLWRKHIIEIAKEQYNNFKIGNFFSVGAMNRLLIESFVSMSCIKKYKKQKIWKEWLLYSALMEYREDKATDEQKQIFINYCKEFGISFDDARKNIKKLRNFCWMHKVMLDKKQITFRDLCNEININGTTPKMIYGDYKFTSNYVHTQNMNIKLFKFTFYERIFHILWIMVNYIINSLNLTIDKRTVTYKKLNMLEYDIDYNIAYLHDKILGKYDYIEKILEETTE